MFLMWLTEVIGDLFCTGGKYGLIQAYACLKKMKSHVANVGKISSKLFL